MEETMMAVKVETKIEKEIKENDSMLIPKAQ